MAKKTLPKRRYDRKGFDKSLLWFDDKNKVQFRRTPDGKELWADYETIPGGFVWRDVKSNEVFEDK